MEANELRINNYVLFSEDSTVFEVTEISKTSLSVKNETEEAWIEIDEFEPIPLTEEWLIKFGFKKIPHFTITNSLIKDIGRNRHISIGSVGTPNEMVFLCETDSDDNKKITDLICLWNFDYDKKLHVHQLQNLYFALKREELTTNN